MKPAWWVLCGVVALASAYAWGQTQVMANQGAPGRQGAWPVTVESVQATINTSSAQLLCTSPSDKVLTIGASAVACPTTRVSGSNFLQICNDRTNTATAFLLVRIDGGTPAFSPRTGGIALGRGDCIGYPVADTVAPKCIANESGVVTTTLECTIQ